MENSAFVHFFFKVAVPFVQIADAVNNGEAESIVAVIFLFTGLLKPVKYRVQFIGFYSRTGICNGEVVKLFILVNMDINRRLLWRMIKGILQNVV